jgi:hypothetical protein
MSDVMDAALARFVEYPERVRLLFERERTRLKLVEAVEDDLGLRRWGGGDVVRTKIRDTLTSLRAEWAENEENGWPNGEDPTLLSNLLRVDYTITKELSKLGVKARAKRGDTQKWKSQSQRAASRT